MKKEKYECAELEIIKFHGKDVIMTSDISYAENETPLVTNP